MVEIRFTHAHYSSGTQYSAANPMLILYFKLSYAYLNISIPVHMHYILSHTGQNFKAFIFIESISMNKLR